MTQKTAVIFGATGLTGASLLEELLNSSSYNRVYAYSRSPIALSHEKLNVIIKPLESINPDAFDELPNGVDVFLCLGTTIAKAGSKDQFKKIDYFLPLKLVNLLSKKASHFLIISSVGAKTCLLYTSPSPRD